MATWFDIDRNRYRWELHALEAIDFKPQVDEALLAQGLLVVRGQAEVNGTVVPFKVAYPTGYPHFRPTVYCNAATLARHQNPFEQALCVVDNGDRGWTAKRDGAYMVKRAVMLLEDTAAGPDVLHAAEVDAPEPVSAYLVPHQEMGTAFLFPESLGPLLPQGEAWGRFHVKVSMAPTLRAVLTEIDVREASQGGHLGAINLPDYLAGAVAPILGAREPRKGIWVKVATPPPLRELAGSERSAKLWGRLLDWAAAEAGQALQHLPNLRRGLVAIVFPDEGPNRGEFQPNWAVVWRDSASTETKSLRPFALASGGYGRIPIAASLKGKRVLMIGAGSVGGTIALELGRAGVDRFVIYDYDVASPPNLVRQEIDLADMGLPKAHVLAHRLQAVNPEVEVTARVMAIGGVALVDPVQANAIHNTVEADIKAADLIVVTTGEAAPMRYINDLAVRLGKPVVFAWVLSGAWGGHAFRVMHEAACYECLDWWAAEKGALEANEPDELHIVYQQGCGLPSFTGPGFDVKAVALAATRLAVQVLDGDGERYAAAPGNHLVISNRGADTGTPPGIQVETVAPHRECKHHGHLA